MADVNPMSGGCGWADLVYESVIETCGYPKKIIELGCGIGSNLEKFKKSKVRVGIDPYKKNIDTAKSKGFGTMILGDHTYLSKYNRNEFDVGFTLSVIDHIEHFEIALKDMLRICKRLVLIEPMIEGVGRQAKRKETTHWKATWYHNYRKFLEKSKVKFSIKPKPLSKRNSGPKYHLIYIECENF